MPGLRLRPPGAARPVGVRLAAMLVAACVAFAAPPVRALDIDIFTAGQVKPNVLIVFDNSGSMTSQAYNTYPNTVYAGTYAPGSIYTRCKTVTASCTCGTTTTGWNLDTSACASGFVDVSPPPSGDDTDDRESRRKRGSRLNFEANPPKNCTLPPFQPCTTATQCTGTGNACSAQSKLAVAKSVMSSVVNDPANDVRFGLEIFNPPGIDYALANYASSTWVTGWQVNSGVYQFPVQDMTTATRTSLASVINGLSAGGATPTAHRLVDAWKYFNGQATAAGFTASPVQQTCQRNYVLMVTDGIPEVEADYNTSPQSACRFTRLQSFVGNPGDLNADGKENPSSPNWIAATGQAFNCGSDYLDDAMVKIRGLQPLGNPSNQQLALYAVSFGFDYCQAPAAGDTSPGAGSLLWRTAERYGGGKCLSATDPDELDVALRAAINMIKAEAQSFVAPVVPVSTTSRTQSGDRLYLTLFTPRDGGLAWAGNIKKYGLDHGNGTICNASSASSCTNLSGNATDAEGTLLKTAESFWDGAGTPSGKSVTDGGIGGLLAARTAARAIYTYTGTATGNLGGLALAATAQAFAKTNAALTPAALGLVGADATTANRDLLIDYVHGLDSFDEDRDGILAERRGWLLGDIIHSSPLVVSYGAGNALVLAGANDGMLHAFDDATGQELWAFVPPDVLPKLNLLRPGQSGTHPFLVDGAAKLRTLADGRKVVVFGLGRGGRAYYGLDVTTKDAPKLLWRVNNATTGFGELGYTTSTPVLARFANAGSPLDVAIFGGGTDFWFDPATVVNANPNGIGRAIYAVNLLTGARVGSAQPAGMSFPIAGDAMVFDVNGDGVFDRGYAGDLGGNLWRIGDDFSVQRLFSTPGHRVYYPPDAVVNAGSVTVYFGTGDRNNPLSTGTSERFYAVRDDGTNDLVEGSLVNVTSDVAQPGTSAATALARRIQSARGWYLVLPGTGEKVLAAPTVYFNVAFTTFTPSSAPCENGGQARLYVVDPLTGSPTRDLPGTSGSNLGGGASGGTGSGTGGGANLTASDRSAVIGSGLSTGLRVAFGANGTKAFLGVSKSGGVAIQPFVLPQVGQNVIPLSWRQAW
ncbi:hypothetical protein KGQ64_09195 [bacterium]|nr:hypothetical protein [bacterium]